MRRGGKRVGTRGTQLPVHRGFLTPPSVDVIEFAKNCQLAHSLTHSLTLDSRPTNTINDVRREGGARRARRRAKGSGLVA